jgi:hypothetical protein
VPAARSDSLSAAMALATALESLADALVQTNVEQMLACEAEIETALAQLPPAGTRTADAAALMRELERARAALVRCQRLGQNLLSITSLSLGVQGRAAGYGRGMTDSDLSQFDTSV